MKYPFEILLENAPNSNELNFCMNETGFSIWSKMSFIEVIEEVEYIRSRYLEEGWDAYDEVQKGNKEYLQELKELNAVMKHIKKIYKEVA